MSDVEVEYKVRRWRRPTLIGFEEWIVDRVTSSFEVFVYFEYPNPGWEV
jgi:hypothetical protein